MFIMHALSIVPSKMISLLNSGIDWKEKLKTACTFYNSCRQLIISSVEALTLENTIQCKTLRHFLFDKIICAHLYELVITTA